jgi:hypothetical protein
VDRVEAEQLGDGRQLEGVPGQEEHNVHTTLLTLHTGFLAHKTDMRTLSSSSIKLSSIWAARLNCSRFISSFTFFRRSL